MANGKCYHHGGKSLVGIESPRYKHGRFSEHLPPLMAEEHARRMERIEEVKRLDEELGIFDQRITQLLGRLQSGERGSVWEDLQFEVGEFRDAFNQWQATKAVAELVQLFGVVDKIESIASTGKEVEEAWRDIEQAFHSKAKLAAMDAKAMADRGEVATKDQVQHYVRSTVDVFREAILAHAPEQAQAIFAEFQTNIKHVIAAKKVEQ
jgi:hypothetical protein